MKPRPLHWVAALAGALTIMLAFWWDARSLLANGVPGWFNWLLLLVGLLIGLVGFAHSLVTGRKAEIQSIPPGDWPRA